MSEQKIEEDYPPGWTKEAQQQYRDLRRQLQAWFISPEYQEYLKKAYNE